MRPSLGKSPVTVLRSIADLTQQELADLLDCSRMTIQAIESGKLRLSQRMAEKISLHTDVSMSWLLSNKYKVPPVCDHDPKLPYTQDAFNMRRADITAPRVNPLDVVSIQNNLAVAYRRLSDAARQAYRSDKIIYFNYMLREFLDEVDKHWSDTRELKHSMDVAEVAAESRKLFERTALERRRAKSHNQSSARR